MTDFAEVLFRRRGTLQSDVFLRSSAVLSVIAIVALLQWPAVGPLIGFFFVTVAVNGPLSPLLPAAYEPVLMVAGRVARGRRRCRDRSRCRPRGRSAENQATARGSKWRSVPFPSGS